MQKILFIVALAGVTTLMTTEDAEAGIFGRRCRVASTCQTSVTYCQPARTRVTVYRGDSCGNYRVAPVRTALARTGQVLHKVLPPYGRGCSGGTCQLQTTVTVQSPVQSSPIYSSPVEKAYPAPAVKVEVTPAVPNVLPKAPVETP